MMWKIRGNSALSKVLGQIRLFRGSTDECVASSGSAITCTGKEQAAYVNGNAYALEAELTKARAIAQWDDIRRRVL